MNSIRNFFSPPAPQFPGVFGNMMNWMQKFQQFCQNPIGSIMGMPNVKIPSNFNGSPKELVDYLVSTGQISQEQLKQFEGMASQMQSMLPGNQNGSNK